MAKTHLILLLGDEETWELVDPSSRAAVFMVTDEQFQELEAGDSISAVLTANRGHVRVGFIDQMTDEKLEGCGSCLVTCVKEEMKEYIAPGNISHGLVCYTCHGKLEAAEGG